MNRWAASTLLLVTLALLVTGCAASKPLVAVKSGTPVPTPPPDPQTVFLASRVDVYGPPTTLSVDLRTQRSEPSASGETSLSVALGAGTGGRDLTVTDPEYEFQAVTPTGTTSLHWPEGAGVVARSEPTSKGFQSMGLLLTLPRDTSAVVLIVHLGPTPAVARRGVRIEVPLKDIPVVSRVVRFMPWGYSPVF